MEGMVQWKEPAVKNDNREITKLALSADPQVRLECYNAYEICFSQKQ